MGHLLKNIRDLYGRDLYNYAGWIGCRLIEINRILKDTGTFYLQCDDSAAYILRPLIDAVFSSVNYRNSIYWVRSAGPLTNLRKKLLRQVDVIFQYSKCPRSFIFNYGAAFRERTPSEKEDLYDKEDAGGRYYLGAITDTGRSLRGRGKVFEFKGITNRWKYSKAKLLKYDEQGLIDMSHDMPMIKYYEAERQFGTLWNDIGRITFNTKDSTGFQTAKPIKLLERIISLSSSPDGLIVDPFCGSGTTGIAAENLGRRWVMIENNFETAEFAAQRLQNHIGLLGHVEII